MQLYGCMVDGVLCRDVSQHWRRRDRSRGPEQNRRFAEIGASFLQEQVSTLDLLLAPWIGQPAIRTLDSSFQHIAPPRLPCHRHHIQPVPIIIVPHLSFSLTSSTGFKRRYFYRVYYYGEFRPSRSVFRNVIPESPKTLAFIPSTRPTSPFRCCSAEYRRWGCWGCW